jgi:RimJ/RimL family protein N-acetyltransferase
MIKGNLVGLRAVEKEDLALLRDWRNNPDFRQNFREVRELSMYNQEKWIHIVNNNPNDFMFVIVDLKTNEAIGACGLLYTNWIIRSADFSFYIGKDDLYIDKKGYAFDAARILIDYGFKNLNLNKIWMELYEFDTKKIEFFTEEFNFQQDGLLRDNCFANGRYWNSYIISLLKKDLNPESIQKKLIENQAIVFA